MAPPRTECTITPKGEKAIEGITYLRNHGLALMKKEGIDYEEMMKKEAAEKKKTKQ